MYALVVAPSHGVVLTVLVWRCSCPSSAPLLQPSWLITYPRRERAASKFLRWASQLAPVGSLLVCGSRAAAASCPSGASAAKVRLGNVLVCNLQLRELSGEQLVLPGVRQQYRSSTTASLDGLIPAGSPYSGTAPAAPDLAAAAAAAAAPGLAGATAAPASDLPAHTGEDDINCFAVSGLTARAVAGYSFGQQRRHLLLALPAAGAAALSGQQQGSSGMPSCSSNKQLWRLPLDMRLRLRAADYALYLLSLQPQALWTGSTTSGSSGPCHADEYGQLYRGALAAEAARFAAPRAAGKHTGAATRWLAKQQRRSSWQLGSPARVALLGSPSGASTPGMSPRAGAGARRAVFGQHARQGAASSQSLTRASSVDRSSSLGSLGARPPPLPLPGVHRTPETGPVPRRKGSSSSAGLSPQELQDTLTQLRAGRKVRPPASEQHAEEGGLMGIGLMRMVKGLRNASQMRLQTQSRAATAGHHSSGSVSVLPGRTPSEAPDVPGSSKGSWTGWFRGGSRTRPAGDGNAHSPDAPGGMHSSAAGAQEEVQPHLSGGEEETGMPAEQLSGPALWLDYADHFMSAGPASEAPGRTGSATGSWSPYHNPQIQLSQQRLPGGSEHDTHSSAGQQQPAEGKLGVTVAQLKVLLGPHSMGMLLQVASSVQQVGGCEGRGERGCYLCSSSHARQPNSVGLLALSLLWHVNMSELQTGFAHDPPQSSCVKAHGLLAILACRFCGPEMAQCHVRQNLALGRTQPNVRGNPRQKHQCLGQHQHQQQQKVSHRGSRNLLPTWRPRRSAAAAARKLMPLPRSSRSTSRLRTLALPCTVCR